MNRNKKLVETIVKGLQEKKGHDIVTVDMSNLSGAICNYMVICQGNNPNQVTSLSDSVWEFANRDLNEKPLSVVGTQNAQWVGMDYGTVLVHIFMPEARAYYRLESLWEDAPTTQIPDIY
ncbi:MAG: ribosome silencing factor [Tannerella sp.]|jgi:ribosome-associated protein|nr:ribosome silencing factor [Tannerella sp.]